MSFYKHYDLSRRPVITEQNTLLSEQNKYTFYVDKLAEKLTVKKAKKKYLKKNKRSEYFEC